MSKFDVTARLRLVGPTVSDLARSRRRLKSLERSVDIKLGDFTKLERSTVKVETNLRSAKKQLDGMAISASRAAVSMEKLARASATINQKNISVTPLSKSNNRPTQIINQQASAQQKLASSTKKTTNSVRELVTATEDFGRAGGLAFRRFAAFSLVTGTIFGTIRAISNATREAISFERELIRISQVTGSNVQNLENLNREIRRLAIGLGVSSSELVKASRTLAQAGLVGSEVRKSLDAIAKSELAPTFNNITQTTEGLIAAFNQFDLRARNASNILGAVNAVAAKFPVESQDMIDAIKRAGGVFASSSKDIGTAQEQLEQFISLFTSVRGTTRESAEAIATGLRTIFTRLQRRSTVNFLEDLGVDLRDAEGKFVGAFKAIQILNKELESLDERDFRFSTIVEEVGGVRQRSRVVPLIKEFSKAEEALKIARQGRSSLDKDAIKAQEALEVRFTKTREAFLNLINEFQKSEGIRTLIDLTLSLSDSLIVLTRNIKPLLPFLTLLGGIKLAGFGAGFLSGRGFFSGVRGGKNSGGPIRMANGGGVNTLLTPGELVFGPEDVKKNGIDAMSVFNQTGDSRNIKGSPIKVPGVGSTDKIPAVLPVGSFVIRKDSAEGKTFGGSIKRLVKGGKVELSDLSDREIELALSEHDEIFSKTGDPNRAKKAEEQKIREFLSRKQKVLDKQRGKNKPRSSSPTRQLAGGGGSPSTIQIPQNISSLVRDREAIEQENARIERQRREAIEQENARIQKQKRTAFRPSKLSKDEKFAISLARDREDQENARIERQRREAIEQENARIQKQKRTAFRPSKLSKDRKFAISLGSSSFLNEDKLVQELIDESRTENINKARERNIKKISRRGRVGTPTIEEIFAFERKAISNKLSFSGKDPSGGLLSSANKIEVGSGPKVVTVGDLELRRDKIDLRGAEILESEIDTIGSSALKSGKSIEQAVKAQKEYEKQILKGTSESQARTRAESILNTEIKRGNRTRGFGKSGIFSRAGRKFTNFARSPGGTTALFAGTTLLQQAINRDTVGAATTGAALSGGVAGALGGASVAGLPGAIVGGVLGAGSSAITAAQDARLEFAQEKLQKSSEKLSTAFEQLNENFSTSNVENFNNALLKASIAAQEFSATQLRSLETFGSVSGFLTTLFGGSSTEEKFAAGRQGVKFGFNKLIEESVFADPVKNPTQLLFGPLRVDKVLEDSTKPFFEKSFSGSNNEGAKKFSLFNPLGAVGDAVGRFIGENREEQRKLSIEESQFRAANFQDSVGSNLSSVQETIRKLVENGFSKSDILSKVDTASFVRNVDVEKVAEELRRTGTLTLDTARSLSKDTANAFIDLAIKSNSSTEKIKLLTKELEFVGYRAITLQESIKGVAESTRSLRGVFENVISLQTGFTSVGQPSNPFDTNNLGLQREFLKNIGGGQVNPTLGLAISNIESIRNELPKIFQEAFVKGDIGADSAEDIIRSGIFGLVKSGKISEEVGNFLRSQISEQFSSRNAKDDISQVREFLQTGEFSKQVIPQLEEFNNALRDAADLTIEAGINYANGLNELARLQIQKNSLLDRAFQEEAQTRFDIARAAGSVFSISKSDSLDTNIVNRLTNRAGIGATSDPTKIRDSIVALKDQLIKDSKERDKLAQSGGQGTARFSNLSENIKNNTTSLNDLITANTTLANATNGLRAVQDKIAAFQESKRAATEFTDLISAVGAGDPKAIRELSERLSSVSNVFSGKGSLEDISSTRSFFDSVSKVKGLDPNVTQTAISNFLIDQIKNSNIPAGVKGGILNFIQPAGVPVGQLPKGLQAQANQLINRRSQAIQNQASIIDPDIKLLDKTLKDELGKIQKGIKDLIREFANDVRARNSVIDKENRKREEQNKGLNSGGFVTGSFRGNRDTELRNMTPGEFVVRRDVAQKNANSLMALNEGESPDIAFGFNNGGRVETLREKILRRNKQRLQILKAEKRRELGLPPATFDFDSGKFINQDVPLDRKDFSREVNFDFNSGKFSIPSKEIQDKINALRQERNRSGLDRVYHPNNKKIDELKTKLEEINAKRFNRPVRKIERERDIQDDLQFSRFSRGTGGLGRRIKSSENKTLSGDPTPVRFSSTFDFRTLSRDQQAKILGLKDTEGGKTAAEKLEFFSGLSGEKMKALEAKKRFLFEKTGRLTEKLQTTRGPAFSKILNELQDTEEEIAKVRGRISVESQFFVSPEAAERRISDKIKEKLGFSIKPKPESIDRIANLSDQLSSLKKARDLGSQLLNIRKWGKIYGDLRVPGVDVLGEFRSGKELVNFTRNFDGSDRHRKILEELRNKLLMSARSGNLFNPSSVFPSDVDARKLNNPLKGLNAGGRVDNILGALTPGEFIVRKEVADKNGAFLKEFNKTGRVPNRNKFQSGGFVKNANNNKVSTQGLDFGSFISDFNKAVDKLSNIDLKIPEIIEIQSAPLNLNVNVTGMENVQESIKEWVNMEISRQIKKHINPLTGETRENFA